MYIKELKNYDAYVNRQNERSHSHVNCNKFLDDIDVSNVNKNYNILDIGCRNPVVLMNLYNMGFKNLYGMDIGENAATHWKSLPIKENLKKHDLHIGIPFDISFDIILFSHVLEHLYNPKLCVELIKNKLNVPGIVYCIIPYETKESILVGDSAEHPNPHYVAFQDSTEHKNFWIENGFNVLKDFSDEKESRLLLQKM